MSGENLSDLIWKAKKDQPHTKKIEDILVHMLSDEQIDAILKLISYRCRQSTKERLRRRLALPLALLKPYGIYSRLYLDGNKVDYICGQDWGSEMKTLRECLIEN